MGAAFLPVQGYMLRGSPNACERPAGSCHCLAVIEGETWILESALCGNRTDVMLG